MVMIGLLAADGTAIAVCFDAVEMGCADFG
jgi:hypothetical protein